MNKLIIYTKDGQDWYLDVASSDVREALNFVLFQEHGYDVSIDGVNYSEYRDNTEFPDEPKGAWEEYIASEGKELIAEGWRKTADNLIEYIKRNQENFSVQNITIPNDAMKERTVPGGFWVIEYENMEEEGE